MIQERACPVCQGRDYFHFADERIDQDRVGAFTYASRKEPEFMCLRLVRCRNCDLVYAPNSPDQKFLQAAYADAEFDSAPEALAAAQTYASELATCMRSIPHRHAAVDVGAGSGPLLPWLKAAGFSPVIGIEPSAAAIASAPPAVKPMLRDGMFSDAILDDVRELSLICSFMTLEHMQNPREFLASAFRLLSPEGRVAIVVHDWHAPLNRLLGRRSPIIDVEHLQLFSRRSVEHLLSTSGFEILELRSIRNGYPLRYWLKLLPLPSGIKIFLAKLFGRLGIAEKILSLNVGNMLAVGVKNLIHE